MNIRQALLQGIGTLVRPTAEELAMLEAKVTSAVEAGRIQGEAAPYAFRVGSNWAIDQRRRAAAAQRRAERHRIAVRKEAKEQAFRMQAAKEFTAAKREFLRLMPRLLASRQPVEIKQLTVVWLQVFEGKTAQECSVLFHGATVQQVWQWKHRGIELLRSYASERLHRVLSRRQIRRTSKSRREK